MLKSEVEILVARSWRRSRDEIVARSSAWQRQSRVETNDAVVVWSAGGDGLEIGLGLWCKREEVDDEQYFVAIFIFFPLLFKS